MLFRSLLHALFVLPHLLRHDATPTRPVYARAEREPFEKVFRPIFGIPIDAKLADLRRALPPQVLERLANELEARLALTRQLRAALAYPMVVLLIALVVLGVMVGWVIPAFEGMFSSLGGQLPAATRWAAASPTSSSTSRGARPLPTALKTWAATMLTMCG